MSNNPERHQDPFEQALETRVIAAQSIEEVLNALKSYYDAGGEILVGGQVAGLDYFQDVLSRYKELGDEDLNTIPRKYGLRAKVKELRDLSSAEAEYKEQLPQIDRYLSDSINTLTAHAERLTYPELYKIFSQLRQHLVAEAKNNSANYGTYLSRLEEWERVAKMREHNVRESNAVGHETSSPQLRALLDRTNL